jgi:hypothetical protein
MPLRPPVRVEVADDKPRRSATSLVLRICLYLGHVLLLFEPGVLRLVSGLGLTMSALASPWQVLVCRALFDVAGMRGPAPGCSFPAASATELPTRSGAFLREPVRFHSV